MKRKTKKCLKNILCSVLTAAMIFTGSNVPELSVYATEELNENSSTVTDESSTEDVSKEETQTEESSEDRQTTAEEESSEESTEIKEEASEEETASTEEASEEEETEEKTSKASDNASESLLGDEGGAKDYIQGGDFNGLVWSDDKFGSWAFDGWDYIVNNGGVSTSAWQPHNGGAAESDLSLCIGFKADGTFNIYQTINEKLPAGTYKLTAWVKAATSAKGFHGTSYSTENLSYAASDTTVESEWTEVSQIFEIKSDMTNYVVGISVTATNGTWAYLDDVSLICTQEGSAGYTLDDLKTLYDTAAALIDGKTADDFKEGYTALTEALATAKELIDNNSTDTSAITEAYEKLKDAADKLVKQSIYATLYYYYADKDMKPCIYLYNINTTTEPAGFKLWAGDTCYKMKASGTYPGWYSIDLEFVNGGDDSNFQIFPYNDAGADTGTLLYKCAKDADNKEAFEKLISKTADAYAVKGDKLYAGDDITTLQRNITLYVYDENGTAAIQSASELSSVDETGTVGKLTADTYTDASSKFYSMKAVEGKKNWYSLTFSVPTADTGNEVFRLNSRNTTDEYTLVKTFINGGTTDENKVDITAVFEGKVYYKDGAFYASAEEAEGIKLIQLKNLINSDDVKAITDKGKDGYTETTWTAFEDALNAAKKLVDETYASADDTTMGDDITVAFAALSDAIDGIEEAVSTDAVTLHYYVGDTIDEVGVVAWNDKISYGTATRAEWEPWVGANCYLMTKSEYAGWYSIDLLFEDEAAVADDKKGFEIYTAAKGEDGTYTPGSSCIYKCSKNYDGSDVYAKLVSKEASAYAVKNGKIYTDVTAIQRNVTLYVYDKEGTPAIMSANPISSVDETAGTVSELKAAYTDEWGNLHYDMIADEMAANWYYLTFSVPVAEQGSAVCKLYRKTADGKYEWVKDFVNNATTNDWEVDITPVFSGNIYYKDGIFTDTKGKAAGLQELIAKAETYVEQDYTAESWAVFKEALDNAKKIVALEEPTEEQIETATEALEKAMADLKYARMADINVEKVALPNDFITGADLSSYISLVESGVVFKDKDGNALSDAEFFKAIADGGTNWVRIRIWDNPYDSSGNSYGGGHNDIETAIKIGKLATNAGMRVLIDFHYSDFWVDPAKYQAPKAWANMSVEQKQQALYDHTYNNLVKLHNAGVDVGMVQVGNETNSGIAGVTYANEADICGMFSAGSKAVRDYSEKYCSDRKAVKVAVHFTDPQDGFAGIAELFAINNVDYDVFATSYYPYWHENGTAEGDTSSLTTALDYVAKTYGKEVMVAETSWATSWEDGDGHDNTSPKTTDNLQYDISVQGQADEMRAVVAAVNSVTNGIGVFYWEPAWISVGYAYNDDGSINQEQLKKNKELWEKYGSGWASSYSAEYDPEDAGRWYGGSAIDNQAWFDFDGTALPTLNTYSYIRTGASSAELKISYVPKNTELTVHVGDDIVYPEKITAKFNNGTTGEFPVKWNEEQQKLISTDKTGEYTIDGVVTCAYNNSVQNVVEKYNVTLTIKVLALESSNQLVNPGFEDGSNGWTIKYRTKDENGNEIESTTVPAGSDYTVQPTNENPYSGTYGMNFYRGDAGISIRVSQEITGLDAGNYDFGGFIQGGSAGEGDVSYAYVKVTPVNENGERLEDKSYTRRSKCELSGWMNWSQPEVSGFTVSKGDIVEVGFEINTSVAGSWGSIDDAYLYGSYSITVDPELKNGTITVSDSIAGVGEKVSVSVIPDEGYLVKDVYLYTLVEKDGALERVRKDDKVTIDENGNGWFFMPKSPVYVTADIKAVSELSDSEKVSLDDVSFEPIRRQMYTGQPVTPEITAVYRGYTLVKGTDFTVEYQDNTAVSKGTAKAVITGTGSFTGTKELPFDIVEAMDLSKATITLKYKDQVVSELYYTGDKVEYDVTVTMPGVDGDLTEGTDYVLEYENNIKVGTAKLHIVAEENNAMYTGSITKTFKIVKADLKKLTASGDIKVSTIVGSTYTGKAVKPNVTIKYGTYTLQKGKDYSITYKNNVKAAADPKPQVIIQGKGNFTGKLDPINFTIAPQNLSNIKIKAKAKTLIENGTALKPSITVTSEISGTLKLGKDYKVLGYTYASKVSEIAIPTADNVKNDPVKEKGIYRFLLEGIGNYSGTTTVDVRVTDKAHNIANAKIEVVKDGVTFTGSSVTLNSEELKVTDSNGNILKFFEDADTSEDGYTLEYENNINAGNKAKVTVIGTGEYAGEKTASFKINKVNISNLLQDVKTAGDKANVRLAKTDNEETVLYYTGYALKPTFEIKPTLESGKLVTLQAGKDYTISFSNNVTGKKQSDGTYLATVKIKGKGNYTGNYTTTFEINPTKLDDFVIKVDNAVYTGKALKPAITFTHIATGQVLDLKPGAAYTVTYKNNKDVANENSAKVPTVTIKAKGLNYAETVKPAAITKTFGITTAKIDASSVADIKVQAYKKGKEIKPALTVKVNGKKLKLNKDYKVTYTNNKLRGQATVTITGIGNYSGTVTKNFTIK